MNTAQFVNLAVTIARKNGWRIETNRDGLTQIDFGKKEASLSSFRSYVSSDTPARSVDLRNHQEGRAGSAAHLQAYARDNRRD